MIKFLRSIGGALLILVLVISFGCKKEEKKEAKPATEPAKAKFVLTSSAFKDGEKIPTKHANTDVSGGENISVPLAWKNSPAGTKSFSITMIDKHPIAKNFVHWLVINIPSGVTSLGEGAQDRGEMPSESQELKNDFGDAGYGGPAPPPGSGVHDYEITIYALSVKSLDLGDTATLGDFELATRGKVLGTAKITGKFSQ